MKTKPQPGTTKFDAHLDDELAKFVAHEHYDVIALEKVFNENGNFHAVKTRSGYSAMIGLINGKAMILHKRPDGSRELEPASLPEPKWIGMENKGTLEDRFNHFLP